jgi:hypothetical protein
VQLAAFASSFASLPAAPPADWLPAWLPGRRFNTRLKGINGGVLLLRPCPAVQQHMTELLDSHPKLRFSYGAAEQDFFTWWVPLSRWQHAEGAAAGIGVMPPGAFPAHALLAGLPPTTYTPHHVTASNVSQCLPGRFLLKCPRACTCCPGAHL